MGKVDLTSLLLIDFSRAPGPVEESSKEDSETGSLPGSVSCQTAVRSLVAAVDHRTAATEESSIGTSLDSPLTCPGYPERPDEPGRPRSPTEDERCSL